jgi:bifunctional UDP-N-acetylglucosamine pyrophosphorylase/glucosamine-1-phosphate N-acetyltransferase
MKKSACVIMAAGKGTRMKSSLSKLLHQVAGKAVIDYTIDLVLALKLDKIVLVLGHQREELQAHLQKKYPQVSFDFAIQHEQLGTAHAVACAEPFLSEFDGHVWILSGDVPCLTVGLLRSFEQALDENTLVGVAGMYLEDPKSYGRLLFDDQQQLYAIREAKDCLPEEYLSKTVNAGLYRVDAKLLFQALHSFDRKNAQGEYYLTDLVEYSSQRKIKTQAWICHGEAASDLEGINDRYDLWLAQQKITQRIQKKAMLSGVTLTQPQTTYIEDCVQFGQDIKIEAGVSLIGHCQIGSHVLIEQGCRLEDTIVEAGAVIHAYTVAVKSKIGAGCQIGPFARLREGTILDENVKIGNFVETKKVHMKKGAKASHLSYLGDAKIGSGSNIGAGVITCNYDGFDKFNTDIGDDVFVGSDCQLVAPVTIGDGAIIGAGTTVTQAVPANALTLSRTQQINKEGWAVQFKSKKKKKT